MSKLKPMNGTVVLKQLDKSEETYGNIVIPDTGKERPEQCEVVATSETYNWHSDIFKPSDLVPGQKVLIPKMGAMATKIDGQDYILIKETEILSIIED